MDADSNLQLGFSHGNSSYTGDFDDSPHLRGRAPEVEAASTNEELSLCDRMITSAADLGRAVFGYPIDASSHITSSPGKTHLLDCAADFVDE